jgi:hypothetical protein
MLTDLTPELQASIEGYGDSRFTYVILLRHWA